MDNDARITQLEEDDLDKRIIGVTQIIIALVK